MFEKLLSKFKKDKKDKKAPKGKKAPPTKQAAEEALDAIGREPSETAVETRDAAPEPAADAGPAGTNGNGKPRVDVIDAMGNSVADMVTNIAQQLSASTEQLSKSRRYTNFAFILLGVTLVSTAVYLGLFTWQMSSRLTQVDETLNMLAAQAGDQDSSNALIEDMRGEITALLQGQAQINENNSSNTASADTMSAEQLRRLGQSLEAMLQNQAATDARMASLGESLKNLDGGGNREVQTLLEDLEQKVSDLYLIEQARIARELQRMRENAVNE
tara:strand:+ start:545 stop:1363 length:819 start_codon:yes stop_codon:yes gene_type:complete